MPKTKISEYSATANSNTDVASINIDEGCAPSGINNAIRAVMGHLKDFQQGTNGDPFNGPVNGTVGATTPSTGAFTTLSASGVFNNSRAAGADTYINHITTGINNTVMGFNNSGATNGSGVTNNTSYIGSLNAYSTWVVGNGATIAKFVSSAQGDQGLIVNGVVGIGTSSPGNKLTVKPSATSSGTLDVLTGSTNTDSVRISGGGTVNTWLEMRGYLGVKLYSDATNTVTVDSSGNLGLGFTPSANAGVSTLSIANYNKTFSALTFGSNANSAGYVGYNMGNTSTSNTWKYISADTGSALYFAGNEFRFMQFASGSAGATTNGTQAMTLDASGRLGITETSPTAKLHIGVASAAVDGTKGVRITNPAGTVVMLECGSGGDSFVGTTSGSDFNIRTNNITRATFDNSGNLLVGKTSSNNGTNGAQLSPTTQFFTNTNDYIALFNRKGTDGVSIYFQKAETNVGNISVTTSATAYNTSSDYRLKNTIAPMTGALAKVALLKPCTYKWNADGSDGEGFIAHELAEVCPHAVTGEKDAVDADGNPKYQGIDTSFLVATLTAAIQELKAEFDAYKASHP